MLIDSHCHLTHKKYAKSVQDLVSGAVSEGVTKIIDIGTSIKENAHVIHNIVEFDEVYGALAIYPHDDIGVEPGRLIESLRQQVVENKKIIGIGECGIDISSWEHGRAVEEQKFLFEEQLKLAVELNLPVVIHNRGGDEIILNLIKKYLSKDLTGVFHCFASEWEFAKKVLDLGFHISFTGMITYPSNKRLLESVKKVPQDRFLIETDAPYLPPQDMRGSVNEPKNVKYVAMKIAEVRGESFENISELSYSNTCALFKGII
ncbi:TatD family deoxyribonuclease [candidate division WWE3 bacterium]|jgi:TatD DNase family protein|uniref:TatD family deoxyribonuclease n=1 Tax=candidate division WWE3 bacterium TaxID=2053526 RepID=A0A3A4ZCP0_UNCKA|nr:MAG: TatD family deoxyribonuclease [candidate division WWE3 bacterium]